MSTKRISTLILLGALLLVGQGCANRKQQAVDRSMLIQENLQLDQALSIAQYELMLARQENDELRDRLGQPSANGGRSYDRMPPLRSSYDSQNGMSAAPTFEANDSTLPPPTNQMPQRFQRQPQDTQMPPQSRNHATYADAPIVQASGVQYVEVPPDAPQWSPQRRY